MASRNYHKNRLKERQRRKAEGERTAALRAEALRYEGVTEAAAARLSREALERIVRCGKPKKGLAFRAGALRSGGTR